MSRRNVRLQKCTHYNFVEVSEGLYVAINLELQLTSQNYSNIFLIGL